MRNHNGLIIPSSDGEYWVVAGSICHGNRDYPIVTIFDHDRYGGILLPSGVVLNRECWLVPGGFFISKEYFRGEKYHLYNRVDPKVVTFLKISFYLSGKESP